MLLVVNWNERINYVPFKAQKVAMIKNNSISSNIQIIDTTDGCLPSHDPIDKLTFFLHDLQKLNLSDFFKISKTVQVRALGIFMGGIEVF